MVNVSSDRSAIRIRGSHSIGPREPACHPGNGRRGSRAAKRVSPQLEKYFDHAGALSRDERFTLLNCARCRACPERHSKNPRTHPASAMMTTAIATHIA